jgi:L-fuconolactonase
MEFRNTRRQFAAGALGGGSLFGSAKPPAIVDSHVHVWKADARYPWAKSTANPPERDATPETLLELMAAAGVERTVIIQVIFYRWDNSYLADVLKRYPRMFLGVARVNPEDPAAPDHLSRLTLEQGFHGVRISPAADASGDWFRGPLMPPLWKRCQELKVPMTVLAPVTRMPDVATLADRFPELTIVVDHMADSPLRQPAELEKLIALRRYPKLFVKISHSWSLSSSPYPYPDSQQQIKRLYDSFGPKRLMAGTDWPLVEKYCSYGQAVDIARKEIPFFTADDRRWICGLTAQQVWPFDS